MGAVALSSRDEEVLQHLQKVLALPSKSQVLHKALEELQFSVERQKLARDIKKSVMKCGANDFKEHQVLAQAAVYRSKKSA